MLPIQVVFEIERLVVEGGLSRRAIARLLGVSRATVDSIATGRRGIYGRDPQAEAEPPAEPPSRCPGCGLLVSLPCVYCRAVDYASRRTGRRPSGWGGRAGEQAA